MNDKEKKLLFEKADKVINDLIEDYCFLQCDYQEVVAENKILKDEIVSLTKKLSKTKTKNGRRK